MPRLPIVFALLTVVLSAPVVAAQVCQGNITLRTQAEVDAFGCTEVTGILTIQDTDESISSLAGLESLAIVGGDFTLLGTESLLSLQGLNALR
ncbi:MAG: hypothetical protein AAFP18_04135, partial [Bacteroidota bacterium]